MRKGPVRLVAEDVVAVVGREIDEGAFTADAGVEDERIESAEADDRGDDSALGVACHASVGDDCETTDRRGDPFERLRTRRPVTATR